MNSSEIFDLIETIAASPKKNDKLGLLTNADCPELRKVLSAAYDPTINYYIKKLVPVLATGESDFDDTVWSLLDDISNRKVTGNSAILSVTKMATYLNAKSYALLERIIFRDMRAGFSESTTNKAFKGLIPEYPYMQYSLYNKIKPESLDWKDGVFVQTKMDGMYTSVDYYHDGVVRGISRQGKEHPTEGFSKIFKHIKDNFLPGFQYHGEVLFLFEGKYLPREEGNGIVNHMSHGGDMPDGHEMVYIIWDMVPLDVIAGKKKSLTYKERFELLRAAEFSDNVQLVKTSLVFSIQEAFRLYSVALANGEEGVMLKSSDLPWKNHKTTKGAKLKLAVDVDLEIIGFTQGKGKHVNTFGAISMQTRDGLLKTDVSGMSDDLRLWIHNNRDVVLGTIATIRGNDVTDSTPASIFLPVLAELRSDKKIADSLQDVIDQFENAKMGK